MPVYSIPSKKDIENYLDEYETEGMSKESLSNCVNDVIRTFQTDYPVFNLDIFFSFDLKEDIDYKTFIRNVIPFLVMNDICRVYYVDYDDGNPYYEFFPNSETNQDKELFLILNDNPDFPDQSIDKEMFESSYTRLDKNGNYIPVKI